MRNIFTSDFFLKRITYKIFFYCYILFYLGSLFYQSSNMLFC